MYKGIKILILIGLILFISSCTTEKPNYTIKDNSVYVDNEEIYINATPHTITNNGWVYLEFKSKIISGDIDLAFGFDKEGVRVNKAQVYNEDTDSWINWQPDGKKNFNYDNKDIWYYSRNRNIEADKLYKLRFYLSTDYGKKGKYSIAIKPSSETFEEAKENKHILLLDPWYNYDLSSGLLAYFSFDDSTLDGAVVSDLTNQGRNATFSAVTTGSSGILQESFLYTGVNDYVNLTSDEEIKLLKGGTINIWTNATGIANGNWLFFKGAAGTSAQNGYGVTYDGGNDRWELWINNAQKVTSNAGTVYDGWQMVTIYIQNQSEGIGSIFVNATNVTSGGSAGVITGSTDNLFIGNTGGLGAALQSKVDELGIWNRSLTEIERNATFNNGLGLAYEPSNILVTNLNITPVPFYPNITNLNCSATLINQNGKDYNATLNWTNGTTLIETNSYTNRVNGSSINDTISKNFGVGEIWGCTVGGVDVNISNIYNYNSTNITINGLPYNNQTYTQFSSINSSAEGSLINFTLRLNLTNVTNVPYDVHLKLNNTRFNITSATSGSTGDYYLYNYTSSVIIPTGFGNTTGNIAYWNWNYSITDYVLGFGTNISNVTLYKMGVDNCSSYGTQILNFSIKDEDSRTVTGVTGIDMEGAVNIISKEDSSIIFNTSTAKASNSLLFCVPNNALNFTSYWLNSIVKYTSTDRATEYYNIINTTIQKGFNQSISLYDLVDNRSTDFRFTFTGSDFLPVENALVYVDRQYIENNTFETVELPATDSNGQTVLHLVRNEILYNIRVIKNGIILGNFERIIAFCNDYTIGDCTIDLNSEQSGDEIFDYDEDIQISYTRPTYNNDTGVVSFSFSTIDGTSKTISMDIMSNSIFGNQTICTNSLTSSSGTLSCNIGTNLTESVIGTNIYVNGQQKAFTTVTISNRGYGVIALFIFFMFLVGSIMTFASQSKNLLLIGLAVCFIAGSVLTILNSSVIGQGASILWLIIIIIVGLWKLNKGRTQ